MCLSLLTVAFAGNKNAPDIVKASYNSKGAVSAISQTLKAKLKSDLVSDRIDLKFENIEQKSISGNIVTLTGSALCILPAEKTQLPIVFNAKIDLTRQNVENIEYKFVESEFAPAAEEELLMKELMKQISRDYKTQDVVIALDGFEQYQNAPDQVQYKGVGEVRIGALYWTKINFDIMLSENQTAKSVKYNLQK